jgi:hypothetical protein
MVYLGIPSQEPEVLSVLLCAIMNMPTPPWTAPIIDVYDLCRADDDAQDNLHAALSWAWDNAMGRNPEITGTWGHLEDDSDDSEEEDYEVITPDYTYTENERETLDELYSWRNQYD